jgi:hypothetical protein
MAHTNNSFSSIVSQPLSLATNHANVQKAQQNAALSALVTSLNLDPETLTNLDNGNGISQASLTNALVNTALLRRKSKQQAKHTIQHHAHQVNAAKQQQVQVENQPKIEPEQPAANVAQITEAVCPSSKASETVSNVDNRSEKVAPVKQGIPLLPEPKAIASGYVPMTRVPPPISSRDPRLAFPRTFIKAINSSDLSLLKELLQEHGTEDMVAVHRYDGEKNPYGRDLIHIDGREKILELWAILLKSSPDFMFTLYETRAFYSHDWNPVITTRYEWQGTRVVDIRVVHNTPSNSVESDQTGLSSSSSVSSAAGDGSNASSEEDSRPDESFYNAKDNKLATNRNDKFYLDSTPLIQKIPQQFTGNYIIHLNKENKVFKWEFVFKVKQPTT